MNRPPVRILYVHHNADTYGASRSLLRLLAQLSRDRFHPLVLLAENGPLRSKLEALNVEVVLGPVSVITRPLFHTWRIIPFLAGLPVSVLHVWQLIRSKRIDLVHTNTGVILTSALAAQMAGVPHIWHIRDWFQEFRSIWLLYSRWILGSSDRVLAVSRAVAAQFPTSPKVEVIHNGFSPEEFAVPKAKLSRAFRDQFNLGYEFVVGCVGRIKWVRKGQEILVQAAALLEKKGIRAKYVIVGAPFPGNETHLDELRRLIRDLNLESRVVLTGELEDTRPAYAAMDVFVLPSAQPEPFGGVVMEAMSMGIPVIATAIGGSLDQIADGVTGFLIPPSDPQALAEKIDVLIRDPQLRSRMAQAGPERIAQTFSLEGMVRRLEQVYLEVLPGSPRA
ncbi:MAG: glycosyltransferase [Verrucomicrobia bacterium]|nr:glycosyltransferase [Verrucomicrobiota bacterium]